MMKMKIHLVSCLLVIAAVVSGAKGSGNVYELRKGDFYLNVTDFGARIISIVLPDKNGKLGDIILGYDSVKEYLNDTRYFGPIVGRVANRIGGAKFTLNGTVYHLDANENANILHGGTKGFSQQYWKVDKYENSGSTPSITFSYNSADGEEGFPGEVIAKVTYTLIPPYKLKVKMQAKAVNKATPINLAQHMYWNIGNHDSGDILSDKIQIFASRITPTDTKVIPTGEITSVKNTPYDFLEPHVIGSQIHGLPNGYDIYYVLDGDKKMNLVAKVYSKKSGRRMTLKTDAPGVQFYTANYVQNVTGKGGAIYQPQSALCLETMGYPDAVNHPNFPSVIVTPKKAYKHNMLLTFSIKK